MLDERGKETRMEKQTSTSTLHGNGFGQATSADAALRIRRQIVIVPVKKATGRP